MYFTSVFPVSSAYLSWYCLNNSVYIYVFIKGPSVVVEPPSGTIVEQRMRGRIGDPVCHIMKGDPFGAQENSPKQPACP